STKVGELRAERIAPDDGVALIARMTEIERARHFWNVAANEVRIPTKAIAGEDHRLTADVLAAAVAVSDFDAVDAPFGIHEQALRRASRQNNNVIRFSGTAQPVDQFAAGAAPQAEPEPGRMAALSVVVADPRN